MSSILSLPFVPNNRASEWVDPNNGPPIQKNGWVGPNGIETILIDCRTPTARPISASRQRFASVPRNMVPHAPKSRENRVGARQTVDNKNNTSHSFLVKVSDDTEPKSALARINEIDLLLKQMKVQTDPDAYFELSMKLMKAACTNARLSAIEADNIDPVVIEAKKKAAADKAESAKQAQLEQARVAAAEQVKQAELEVARKELEVARAANAKLQAMPPTSAKPENSHNRSRARNPSRGRGQRQPTPSR